MKAPFTADHLLKIKEASAYLGGVSPRTISDWRKAGVIACISRPGFLRFLRADLDDFIARHRVAAKTVSKFRPRRKKAENTTTGEAQQP